MTTNTGSKKSIPDEFFVAAIPFLTFASWGDYGWVFGLFAACVSVLLYWNLLRTERNK